MGVVLHLSDTTSFQQERAQDCFAEAKPLLEAHWAEIARHPDLPFDPDWQAYQHAEDAGRLRAYSIRECGELVGYAVYFVAASPHSRAAIYAVEDILYVHPAHRGLLVGARFIQWCDEQLRAEGVFAVAAHVNHTHDYGPLLKRLGYKNIGTVWERRLASGG